jgi:hypothetical protein
MDGCERPEKISRWEEGGEDAGEGGRDQPLAPTLAAGVLQRVCAAFMDAFAQLRAPATPAQVETLAFLGVCG